VEAFWRRRDTVPAADGLKCLLGVVMRATVAAELHSVVKILMAGYDRALGGHLRSQGNALRGQHAMDKRNCDRSFTDGRGHALDVAAPHIAHGEHARKRGFEQVR
jgi:hypothetical protein